MAQGSSLATAVVRIRFPTPVCDRVVVARSRLVVFFRLRLASLGKRNLTSLDCRRKFGLLYRVIFSPVVGKVRPLLGMTFDLRPTFENRPNCGNRPIWGNRPVSSFIYTDLYKSLFSNFPIVTLNLFVGFGKCVFVQQL